MDVWIGAGPALIGALIGGLISYFTTVSVERRRFRSEDARRYDAEIVNLSATLLRAVDQATYEVRVLNITANEPQDIAIVLHDLTEKHASLLTRLELIAPFKTSDAAQLLLVETADLLACTSGSRSRVLASFGEARSRFRLEARRANRLDNPRAR